MNLATATATEFWKLSRRPHTPWPLRDRSMCPPSGLFPAIHDFPDTPAEKVVQVLRNGAGLVAFSLYRLQPFAEYRHAIAQPFAFGGFLVEPNEEQVAELWIALGGRLSRLVFPVARGDHGVGEPHHPPT